MKKNNKVEEYRKELKELEVSKLDTSNNYKQAEEFMLKIVNDEEVTIDDKTIILKEVYEKFSLNEEQKLQLNMICKEQFDRTQQGKDAYINNLIEEMSDNTGDICELVPYMGFTEEHGLNYMAIMRTKNNKKVKCFVSSKKECYKYDDCEDKGIYLKHTNNSSKFMLSSFMDYIKNADNVTAGNIFNELKAVLQKYIIFPVKSLYDIVSLWIMHTYVYCLFRYVPYIWLNAEAGSGKSTVIDVVKEYSFNGLLNVGSTPAVVYRTIENNGSTLFLDEFENMTGEDKGLILTILNQGFKVGAEVSRCSANNFIPETFSAFSPKLFAGITDIDNVLLTRCIKINMKQAKDISKIEEFQLHLIKNEIAKTVNQLHIFGLKYADKIRKIYQNKELLVFPKGYTPREKDLWKPLYAIAKIVDEETGEHTMNSILEYAKILRDELNKEKYKEVTPRLIKYLEVLVNEQDTIDFKEHWNWYSIDEIYYFFKDTGEFPEIKSYESLGKYLSKFELEKDRLKSLGINGKKKTSYHITKEDIEKLKKKYDLDTM